MPKVMHVIEWLKQSIDVLTWHVDNDKNIMKKYA